MAPIEHSVEIDRPPDQVYAYLEDLRRHSEWQDGLVVEEVDGDGGVGTHVTQRRQMGGREQTVKWDVTAKDPPRTFDFKGTSGPLRPVGGGRLVPLDDGSRTKLTFHLDFEPHGIGYVLRPLARKQARQAIPRDHAKLKEILESGGD